MGCRKPEWWTKNGALAKLVVVMMVTVWWDRTEVDCLSGVVCGDDNKRTEVGLVQSGSMAFDKDNPRAGLPSPQGSSSRRKQALRKRGAQRQLSCTVAQTSPTTTTTTPRINGSEPMQNDQAYFFSDIFLNFMIL